MELKCIDFFAGIGAWELASISANLICSEVEFKTIEFIEINRQAQKVLRSHFPQIPIYSDVRSYEPSLKQANVYFVSFPCTGTSAAGSKTGLSHEESGLWFEVLRCVITGQPEFIIIEQPAGIIDRGLREIINGLRVAGYQAEIEVISAAEFGAPHLRQRVFVIAHANHLRIRQKNDYCCWSKQTREHVTIAKSFIPHPEAKSSSVRMDDGIPQWLDGVRFDGWWLRNPQPEVSGVGRYLSGRRDCVSLYGKSIVPLQALVALMRVQFLAML